MFPSHFMFAGQVTENNCSSSTDRTTRTRFPTKSSIKEHNNFQLRGRSFFFFPTICGLGDRTSDLIVRAHPLWMVTKFFS